MLWGKITLTFKIKEMKTALAITSVESNITFQERILVDFVNRNLSAIEPTIAEESFSADFSTINWASTNIPVNGRLDILFSPQDEDNIDRFSLPVISLFFITCTKETTGIRKVAWCRSMS